MTELCHYCGKQLIGVSYYMIAANHFVLDPYTGQSRLHELYDFAFICEDCFKRVHDEIMVALPPLGTAPPSPQPSQPSPLIREREIITRVVVLIPCQYCGGLISQTATFCPHCGAKRKA